MFSQGNACTYIRRKNAAYSNQQTTHMNAYKKFELFSTRIGNCYVLLPIQHLDCRLKLDLKTLDLQMASCWNCNLPYHAYDCPRNASSVSCKTCGKVFHYFANRTANENSLRQHEKTHLPKTTVCI